MIDFKNWTIRRHGNELRFTHTESPFRFCVEDDCWVCDYDQLHCSGFGDSPEEALAECLDQMKNHKILLDAAIAVGVQLKNTGRL